MHRSLWALTLITLAAILPQTVTAATEEDFKTAYASAQAKNAEAGKLKNQWTTTDATLNDAQQKAGSGNYDEAVRLAKHAEALAVASIAQVKEQEKAWKAAEIR